MFNFVNGKPNSQFAYNNPQLADTMNKAIAATDPAQVQQYWVQAQHMIAADMPTVPLENPLPAGAMQTYVQGFVGAGNLGEPLNTVWLNK